MATDYYELLGVDRGASADDLKRAYRKLAREYHPAANPDDQDAEAKFKEVSEAYAVLSDDDARARYDQFGHDGLRSGGMGGDPFNFDLNDIFENFFGGNPFGGGRTRGPSGPPPGEDQQPNQGQDNSDGQDTNEQKSDSENNEEQKTDSNSEQKSENS